MKALEVIGWLGSSGYRLVIDESTRLEAEQGRHCQWCLGRPHNIPIDGIYHCPACCLKDCSGER